MAHYADTGQWPADQAAFTDDPGTVTGWDGPYIDKWPPKNPWGGSYTYMNGTDLWDGDGDTEVYIRIDLVNDQSQDIIDAQIDGAEALDDGDVQEDVGGNFSILIADES